MRACLVRTDTLPGVQPDQPSLRTRHGHNLALLMRFGIVGVSGVVVNLVVLIVLNRLGPDSQAVFFDLPVTRFNVRWYHAFSTVGFLVANLWNFQINRWWTFRSAGHARWWSEYLPFLAVGLAGLVANLGILTLLLHPGSVFSLPRDVFDASSGFRDPLYWGQLIAIAIVTPLSFVLNKLWTFSAVRGTPRAPTARRR